MALRTDFPNTNGGWVGAPGNPLVEIRSDGSGINVGSRPAGGRSISDLTQGDRLAFQYQSARYFFGEEAAAALKAELSAFHALATLQTPDGVAKSGTWTAQQEAYAANVNAQRSKDAADAAAALASGSYATPAPPPPPVVIVNNAPPAQPIITAETRQAVLRVAGGSTAIVDPMTLGPSGAQLVTSAGTPVAAALADFTSSSKLPLVIVGVIVVVGVAWYLLRGGGS